MTCRCIRKRKKSLILGRQESLTDLSRTILDVDKPTQKIPLVGIHTDPKTRGTTNAVCAAFWNVTGPFSCRFIELGRCRATSSRCLARHQIQAPLVFARMFADTRQIQFLRRRYRRALSKRTKASRQTRLSWTDGKALVKDSPPHTPFPLSRGYQAGNRPETSCWLCFVEHLGADDVVRLPCPFTHSRYARVSYHIKLGTDT